MAQDSSERAPIASETCDVESFFHQYSEKWNQERLKDISFAGSRGKKVYSYHSKSV